MTEVRERRITSEELRHVVVTCGSCAAEVSVDLKNDVQAQRLISNSTPICPICDVALDSGVAGALREFTRWYRTLHQADRTIGFRLPIPPAEESTDGPTR